MTQAGWTRRALQGAAAALAAGGSAKADKRVPGTGRPSCRIDEQASPDGVILRGHAAAETAWSGRYRLAVEKQGPFGRSNIVQGGALKLEPGQDASFGQVTIGLEAGARYDTVLTMTAEGDGVECRTSGPQDAR